MHRWLLVLLVACACPSKQPAQPQPGSAAPPSTDVTCDAVKPKVEALYRAEAQAKEPNRVDEAVADNTRMVMNDCAKDSATVARCIVNVGSVAQLEKDCLVQLDDEGTEGR